jgi:hypothetical protein
VRIKNQKIGIESITFTGTGRNLWLWTEDKTLGQDPETNLTGGSNGRGLQYFNSPNSKSIIFSVNLKFNKMKKINIQIVTLCTLIISAVGCTSYVDDLNVDPDNLLDSDSKNLFQGVLLANQFSKLALTLET